MEDIEILCHCCGFGTLIPKRKIDDKAASLWAGENFSLRVECLGCGLDNEVNFIKTKDY